MDYIAIGSRIRQIRKLANMTQQQLAELCDCSHSLIGHIEKGSRVPSIKTICKISAALHVSLDFLLTNQLHERKCPYL